ncbi:hypothetical protein [Fluviicola chungangensis]|uniref:Lipoprotein n=1 Tax=Fluviicola chungangensis TaxID=2597671 RepID=A0A556N832_9FLAO|nr:hypothetical protein [Fluviicola chungangensis]TSJ48243.1 hypothetical protein FO442_03635 [Fluviicola chungangensis]
MKTHVALFIGVAGLLFSSSCSSDPVEDQTTALTEKTSADSLETDLWFPETDFDTLCGLYTGDFGDGFINVVLTYVNDKKAIGYNVHKGLQRNISGSVVQKADRFELTLNEPGDNPYDGIFVLNISKKDGHVDASWTANDPKIKAKKFTLKKQPVKQTDASKDKTYYDDGEITEDNFMDLFSNANLGDGYVEFKENGILRFSYYPEGQEKEQQEIIKGSWKFSDPKTLIINWSKNTHFKQQIMKFKLSQNKDEMPSFDGPNELSIYPDYY